VLLNMHVLFLVQGHHGIERGWLPRIQLVECLMGGLCRASLMGGVRRFRSIGQSLPGREEAEGQCDDEVGSRHKHISRGKEL